MSININAPIPDIHAGFEKRQLLMDRFMAECRRHDADPSAAVSAALYVAATAGLQGLSCNLEQFLAMAKVVFDDVQAQTTNRVVS